MSQNFLTCDRGQVLLMPPSLADWVDEDHLVWTVLEAVKRMDLTGFYGAYRANGQGRAAYDPEMMVGLLLYSYARGNGSSRGIERACREDVTYKLITAMRTPDHSTIAEFRRRHEVAIGELFVEVLALCQEAGLVSVGVIAIDGTKIRASASRDQNRSYAGIVAEILDEAERIDREEDEQHGDARGDELPERFRSRESRREALAEAKQRLDEKKAAGERDTSAGVEPAVELDPERLGAHAEGRRGWLRNGRRQLDEQRERDATAVARSRAQRLADAKRRLEERLAVEIAANAAYEDYRARGVMSDGRRFGVRPDPYTPLLAQTPDGEHHRQRHPGPDPPGLRPQRKTARRVDRRALRPHAPCAEDRAWTRDLPATQTDRRARVRTHKTQPPDRPLPAPRPRCSAFRMAADRGHPQPRKAPHPPESASHRLIQAITGRPGAPPTTARRRRSTSRRLPPTASPTTERRRQAACCGRHGWPADVTRPSASKEPSKARFSGLSKPERALEP